MAILIVGASAGWDGFGDTGSSTSNSIAWHGWIIGWLVALGAGPVAWEHGHHAGSRRHRRTGQLAVAYVLGVVALLIAIW